MTRRRLGTTDLWISPVAMGCWPIAGITSIGVTESDSLATMQLRWMRGSTSLIRRTVTATTERARRCWAECCGRIDGRS